MTAIMSTCAAPTLKATELNPVALALLPPEIEVGSKVKCEYFQYEVIG